MKAHHAKTERAGKRFQITLARSAIDVELYHARVGARLSRRSTEHCQPARSKSNARVSADIEMRARETSTEHCEPTRSESNDRVSADIGMRGRDIARAR